MPEDSEQNTPVRVRSASWIFGAQVLSLAASFPMSILLARALGPEGKGTLSVVQLIASFSAILLNFGIGQALTYYGARREASGRDTVVMSYGFSLVVVTILATVMYFAGDWLSDALNVNDVTLIWIGTLATFPVLLAQFLNAYVVGTGAIRNASLVSVGSLVFQLISMVVLWALGRLTPESAILVWAMAVSGVALALTWMAWPRESQKGVAPGPAVLLRRMWRYGIAAWPAGILGTAAQRFDVFLLAYFQGPAAVGVYSIAVTMAELSSYVPNALSGVLIPKVAAAREAGMEITLRLGRVTWIVTALTGLAVFVVGAPLIPLVFGSEFRASIVPLACILPGIVMLSLATTPSSYLAGMGHPGDLTIAAGLNVFVNITANVILDPLFGATGAAIASSLSYAASAILIITFFVRRSGAPVGELLIPRLDDFTLLISAARTALRREG